MIRWNKATALATGLIMIVLGNAVALTGAYYNRSGKPDAKVTLTQRDPAIEIATVDGLQPELARQQQQFILYKPLGISGLVKRNQAQRHRVRYQPPHNHSSCRQRLSQDVATRGLRGA